MLREVLSQRVRDGVLLRLIGKWLNAGVLEGAELSYPDAGTPQGGVVSPILANIFLHAVLDVWFHDTVVPRLSHKARLYRFADDAVLLFDNKSDAMKVMRVLPKRFGRFGLTLHPDKTRLVEFRRPDQYSPRGEPNGPGTFDLLGFTHYWGKTLSGKWTVKRKTAKDRFRRALKRVREWCTKHLHLEIREQQRALGEKLRGHYGYYGIRGNSRAIHAFLHKVQRTWCKRLRRRSQCAKMNWDRMNRMLQRCPLPRPKIMPPPPMPPQRVANL
jgi:RNA-directed DNA polymerase